VCWGLRLVECGGRGGVSTRRRRFGSRRSRKACGLRARAAVAASGCVRGGGRSAPSQSGVAGRPPPGDGLCPRTPRRAVAETLEGETVAQLEKAFRESVEDHLATREAVGRGRG